MTCPPSAQRAFDAWKPLEKEDAEEASEKIVPKLQQIEVLQG